MMRSRFVNPRASRTQLIVASVPLLHRRTFCTPGTHSQTSLAISRPRRGSECQSSGRLWQHSARHKSLAAARGPESQGPRCRRSRSGPCHPHPRCALLWLDAQKRLAADTAKGPHGRVHTAGDVLLGEGEASWKGAVGHGEGSIEAASETGKLIQLSSFWPKVCRKHQIGLGFDA